MRPAVGLLLAASAAIFLIGCGTGQAPEPKAKAKREGGHIRVLNTTEEPVSIVFGRRRLGDSIAPGDANLFQKEVPGTNAFVVQKPGALQAPPLADLKVELKSGTPTTYVLRRSGDSFTTVQIENEPRMADGGSPTVTMVSLDPAAPVAVALKSSSTEVALGQAEGFGIRETKPVPAGLYRLMVNGKPVGSDLEIKAAVAYSVFVFSTKAGPTAALHRNTPAMSVAGFEGAAGAN